MLHQRQLGDYDWQIETKYHFEVHFDLCQPWSVRRLYGIGLLLISGAPYVVQEVCENFNSSYHQRHHKK
jgi:hypothetical protein